MSRVRSQGVVSAGSGLSTPLFLDSAPHLHGRNIKENARPDGRLLSWKPMGQRFKMAAGVSAAIAPPADITSAIRKVHDFPDRRRG